MEEIVTTNGTDPSQMTPAERLDELSTLLAMAVLRTWLRRRKERAFSRDSACFGKDSLGNPVETRPPVTAGKP